MIEQQLQKESIQKNIDAIESILQKVNNCSNFYEKSAVLEELPAVQEFLANLDGLKVFVEGLNPYCKYAIKSVIAIGQGPIVFRSPSDVIHNLDALKDMLFILLDMERVYAPIGGVIGYHLAVLRLIQKEGSPEVKEGDTHYLKPIGTDISEDTPTTRKAVRWGIESIPMVADIYPVGGAGDRLNLIDEDTGQPLPAAQLKFLGRTLLDGMFRDLEAREFLYYKFFGTQVTTPVALMTSDEKNNHEHVKSICSSANWFGRPSNKIILFAQPLVPVITKEGSWSLSAPLKLMLKPGGHGVIWKMAMDEGVFDWFFKQNRKKACVRQINNPIAAVDHGLFAFMGIGVKKDKAFGFASCPRRLSTAEGMDVLIEKKKPSGFDYCLTNVEYTEFTSRGIEDVPEFEGSGFSAFPCNTNILFADLQVVEAAVAKNPIPGMLINMKTKASVLQPDGSLIYTEGGRLESTMQNIADLIVDHFDRPITEDDKDRLSAFITFNKRRKTISVTKSSYAPGKPFLGTPESCLYEMLLNHEELLRDYCRFQVPSIGEEKEFISRPPAFLFHFHPALGPLWSIIGQKIQRGSMAAGSEIELEIADIMMADLHVQGSLRILAENITGSKNTQGLLAYGAGTSKCILKNVKISNEGIDYKAANKYWKRAVQRNGECLIVIHGNGELYAEDVDLTGNMKIEVPSGYRMTILKTSKGVEWHSEPIQQPSWNWRYSFDEDDKIVLTFQT